MNIILLYIAHVLEAPCFFSLENIHIYTIYVCNIDNTTILSVILCKCSKKLLAADKKQI